MLTIAEDATRRSCVVLNVLCCGRLVVDINATGVTKKV